jgi:hypothetical protein
MDALTRARESLIETVVGKMPEQHRQFLLSFERGNPNGLFSNCLAQVICLRLDGGERI